MHELYIYIYIYIYRKSIQKGWIKNLGPPFFNMQRWFWHANDNLGVEGRDIRRRGGKKDSNGGKERGGGITTPYPSLPTLLTLERGRGRRGGGEREREKGGGGNHHFAKMPRGHLVISVTHFRLVH
jgi:hypothetical protein